MEQRPLNRYIVCVFFVGLLILMDLSINSILAFHYLSNKNLLVTYIIQDVGIILSLILLFCLFFSTFMFKVGLISLILERFKWTIVVSLVYLGLSVALHIWILLLLWYKDKKESVWRSNGMLLFAIQRFVSPFYYYLYKRAALRVSDPRFYEDEYWIQEELKKRNINSD